MAKKKQETIEDILDRIMDDIEMIREKCVCNGDENYEPEEDEYYDEDSSDDEDEAIGIVILMKLDHSHAELVVLFLVILAWIGLIVS
jgi:excinuclease UvrABC helicase subunit UvrB